MGRSVLKIYWSVERLGIDTKIFTFNFYSPVVPKTTNLVKSRGSKKYHLRPEMQAIAKIKNHIEVLKKVDRPTRLPCTWSGFCCLCHNVALLSTFLNGRLF